VSTQAELLSLNRSSLYYQPVPPSAEEVALKHRIDQISTDYPFYGYRKITKQLQLEGLQVNHKAVARQMREMGLEAVYPGPASLPRERIKRACIPSCSKMSPPARRIISGGSIARLFAPRKGWMYLVAVLDWYSRYVVSWLRHEVACVAVETG